MEYRLSDAKPKTSTVKNVKPGELFMPYPEADTGDGLLFMRTQCSAPCLKTEPDIFHAVAMKTGRIVFFPPETPVHLVDGTLDAAIRQS